MCACAHFVCSDIFSSTYHRCAMAPGIAHVGLFHGDTPVRKVTLLQARRGEGGPSGTSCRCVPSVSDSGSSSKRPRVHSVSESRRRGRGAGFKVRPHTLIPTHSRSCTLIQAQSHAHSRVCVRAQAHSHVCVLMGARSPRSLPRVRACLQTLTRRALTRNCAHACVRADAHPRTFAHVRQHTGRGHAPRCRSQRPHGCEPRPAPSVTAPERGSVSSLARGGRRLH